MNDMLRSYLTIAFRNLQRRKVYTFINLLGLALGMSVCLFVLLLARDQKRYDRFHPHVDRLYRAVSERIVHGEVADLYGATPADLGPALARDVPGVERTVRLARLGGDAVHTGKSVHVEGLYAEPAFFELFGFDLVAGSPAEALAAPGRVVLSDEMARRIFGETDPMGQVLTLGDAGDVTVTGVVRTTGVRSHLRFDVLASFETLETTAFGRRMLAEEANFWFFATYLRLADDAARKRVAAYLDRLVQPYADDDAYYRMDLQAVSGISLGPMMGNEVGADSMPGWVVLLLGGMGLLVLAASAFNYVGLTVARALERAKEVGVRKTVGARRRQIVFQLLSESVLVALGAFVLAYALLTWLVQGFNRLNVMQHEFELQLREATIYDPVLVAVFVAFSVGVGLLGGLYPALVLSRFRPVQVLKGAARGAAGAGLRLRRVLVVLQLTFSLVFIVTTVLLYRQVAFVLTFDYGFRTDGLVNVSLQGNDYGLLRQELLRHPDVLEVSATSALPVNGARWGSTLTLGGPDTLLAQGFSIDPYFVDNLGLTLVAGRNFSPERPDGANGVLLNETAVRRLGFDRPHDALGQVIFNAWVDTFQTVLGVVQDYHFDQSIQAIGPLTLVHAPSEFTYVNVRLRPGRTGPTLAHLASVWKGIDPVHPLEYSFFDAYLRESEVPAMLSDVLRLIGFVALLALTIACLGLLGIAFYSAEVRTKEVGVRKVLGAGVAGLVWLLSKELLGLFFIAAVLAVPAAWFGNHLWLDTFVHRAPFGPGVFVVGTGLVLALALAAIGSQAWRAARANPVETLRYE